MKNAKPKNLPERDHRNALESQGNTSPILADSLNDCELASMAKEIIQRKVLTTNDSWLWSAVTRFHDHAEDHLEEVRRAVLRWLESEKGGGAKQPRTAVRRGNLDAAISVLVCVADRVLSARENDGVGVGVEYMPLIPRLGLDLLDQIRLATANVKALKDLPEESNEIRPGWNRGKLVLKSLPSGKEPALFTFGSKSYTVPSGKAWDTVCAMIRADAFDAHGMEMKTPSGYFKREHRPFFSERMTRNKRGWYIKTQ